MHSVVHKNEESLDNGRAFRNLDGLERNRVGELRNQDTKAKKVAILLIWSLEGLSGRKLGIAEV